MKIAIYHNLGTGGAKRALFEMTRRLSRRHSIDVYTLSTAEHEFCDLRPYCRHHKVYSFSSLPQARSPFGRLNQGIRAADLVRLGALQQKIAHEIDSDCYDVVFVHHCRFGQSPALLRFLETPSAYMCHEPPRALYEPEVPRPYNESTPLQRAGNLVDPFPCVYRQILRSLDRANVDKATVVLANSDFSRESLYRVYGIFARTIRLGVDVDHFAQTASPEADFVLSVGHLNARKGFDFVITSLAVLNEDVRPSLVIVSDFSVGPEKDYLADLAQRLGVSLTFRTRIPEDELVRLYNQARLTVYAPVMEPFGFVPLESMACGTPVVAVREGGVRETMPHGQAGVLTERDHHRFADAIQTLCTDDSRRHSYGAYGRWYVEASWGWDRSIVELEQRLCETVA